VAASATFAAGREAGTVHRAAWHRIDSRGDIYVGEVFMDDNGTASETAARAAKSAEAKEVELRRVKEGPEDLAAKDVLSLRLGSG